MQKLFTQREDVNEALDFEDVMYLRDEQKDLEDRIAQLYSCLLYTSPSPRDRQKSRMPSSA